MTQLTPKQAADRLAKWAAVGFDFAVVGAVISSLEQDRSESAGRAPRKSGRLAATIRIVKPRTGTAAKKGFIIGSLAAGNKVRKDAGGVPYGRITQTGKVFLGVGREADRTKPHDMRARFASYSASGKLREGVLRFRVGGQWVFARHVKHPGSRVPARDFLQINQSRAAATIDSSLQRSADQEIG